MGWLDTIVVVLVVAVGLMIMYKALKEPIDMLLNMIKNMFGAAKDKISDTAESGYDTISYG